MRHGKIMEKRSKKKKYLWCQVPSHEVCMSGTPIKIEKKKKVFDKHIDKTTQQMN